MSHVTDRLLLVIDHFEELFTQQGQEIVALRVMHIRWTVDAADDLYFESPDGP